MTCTSLPRRPYLLQSLIVTGWQRKASPTQDFSEKLNPFFQLLESTRKKAFATKGSCDTKCRRTERLGNRKTISERPESAPEGLVRWHWPRRPNNWLGMTESRDPASLLMMRSWDAGAGGQPVSHDLGSSIKVAQRINL